MQAAPARAHKPALFFASRVLAREDRQCDGAPEVIGAPSAMRAIIASRLGDTSCRIPTAAPQVASRVAVHRAAACRIFAAAPPSACAALDSPGRPGRRKPNAAVSSPPEPPMARGPQRGRRRDAHPTAGVHQPPHGAGRAQGDLGDALHDARKVFGRQTPPYHNLSGRAHDGRRGDRRVRSVLAREMFRRGRHCFH